MRTEEGQVAPLLAGLLLVVVGSMVVLVTLAAAQVRRARARTAADAAALAAAAEGDAAGAALAAANGAQVLGIEWSGDDVEVRVALVDAEAAASAHREVIAPGDGGDRDGLAPAMLAALARADALLGRSVPVVSGYRSRGEQQWLWDRRATNPYPVAPPGRSRHESGLAVDVPGSFVADLVPVAARAGLCRPLPQGDPIHFELCPIR
jgi:D-alanyl-D-alanine carboxypeptidase/Putative Flp pilus-assembly TadE/G-like